MSSRLRQVAIFLARTLTSAPPRIKGLGVILGWVAAGFRRWNEDVEIVVFGNRMLLNCADYLGNIVLFTPKYYDIKERAIVKSIVGQGDYVVDIGANIGIYTLILANLVAEDGAVVAIEAEQNNADRLRHNLAINCMPWVAVQHCGVSDKYEELVLALDESGNAGAHSFVDSKRKNGGLSQSVACVPLYSLLDKVRAPAFMKLDIEGFEYRVLRQYFADAPKHLWPQHIMLEDAPTLREGDAVALAISQGYRLLHRIDDNVFLVKQ